MGLFLRKSKNFGPFRLNLSKSGLGLSTGIKGARISVGPSGTYISGGRNGLYYREKIGGKKKTITRSARTNYRENNKKTDYQGYSSIENISNDINKTYKLYKLWLICFIASIVFAILFGKTKVLLLSLVLLIAFFVFKNRLIFKVDYDLDQESNDMWQVCLKELKSIFSCKKSWIIYDAEYNYYKTNAGTSRTVKRKVVTSARIIKTGRINKSRTKFNYDVFQIVANKASFIFTPSMVIIIKGSKINSYSYKDFYLYIGSCYFVEDSKHTVPRDAKIVSYSWQYVNRDGSRDLRYSNNKQRPNCEYGCLKMDLENGPSIQFEFSDCSKVESAKRNIYTYVEHVKYLPIIDHIEKSNIVLENSLKDEKKNIQLSEETKELLNKQSNPLIQDIYDNMDLGDKDE